MGYEDKKVSKVQAATARYAEDIAKRKASMTPQEIIDCEQGVAYIDGMQVSPNLAEFAELLRKQMRGVHFGTTIFNDVTTVVRQLFVFFPDDEYCLGAIGHGDYSIQRDGLERKYMVASRTISNDKFKPHRPQYNMSMTDDVRRAVKTALKNLRRYSLTEMAALSYDVVQDGVGHTRSETTQTAAQAKNAVCSSPLLFTELNLLLDSGHKFSSDELRSKIVAWRDAHRERSEKDGQAWHMYYVYVKMVNGQQVFNVAEMFDVGRTRIYDAKNLRFNSEQAYTLETLPENIAHKVAALSMLETGKYVHDLGARISDSIFWVSRDVA